MAGHHRLLLFSLVFPTDPEVSNVQSLAVAVIQTALKDARSRNGHQASALHFIQIPNDGFDFRASVLGVTPERLRAVLLGLIREPTGKSRYRKMSESRARPSRRSRA